MHLFSLWRNFIFKCHLQRTMVQKHQVLLGGAWWSGLAWSKDEVRYINSIFLPLWLNFNSDSYTCQWNMNCVMHDIYVRNNKRIKKKYPITKYKLAFLVITGFIFGILIPWFHICCHKKWWHAHCDSYMGRLIRIERSRSHLDLLGGIFLFSS